MNGNPHYMVTHYAAPNDINGNARRCFVVRFMREGSDCAEVVKVIDEGCTGDNFTATIAPQLPAHWRNVAFDAARVQTTPGQYRAFIKLGKQMDAARNMVMRNC